jgi:hypothetical protein
MNIAKLINRQQEASELIDLIQAKACEAREGLNDQFFSDHDGQTGAALWTIFDQIWNERMRAKDGICTELFKTHLPEEEFLD